jgi:phospholipid/cholesterol/gamma-HCH transport system substrate-binding protein
MMNDETKVGLFVVLALSVLTYFMINTGTWDLFGEGEDTYQIKCQFNNVVGLTKGAGVSLSGVKIGEVIDISLAGQQAMVVMAIGDNFDFPATSKARISSVGLLGQASVEIIPGPIVAGEKSARELMQIGSLDPVTLDQLVAVLQGIGGDASALADSIEGFLYENQNNFESILDNLRNISNEVKQVVIDNKSMVTASVKSINNLARRLGNDIPPLLAEVKVISSKLKALLDNSKDNVQGGVEKARELMDKLDGTATTLQEILDKINQDEGSLGKLINNPDTIDQASDLMFKAEQVVSDFEEIMKSPSKLNFDYGFRAEFFNKSEDFKYYYQLSTHLNNKDVVRVELINDRINNGPTAYYPGSGIDNDNAAANIFGNDFTFSATYGRKISGGTIRLGLIESTTGLAFDIGSSNGPFALTLEGYDFGRDSGPHVKALANLQLWKNMHLSFGFDDFLDDEHSQWFLGGGVRF